jgi:DnaJ-class molecular chaperone
MLTLLLAGRSLSLIQSEGTRDFYDILGLAHDCQDRDIDLAFQKLSRRYHPDKNKGDPGAAERFTDINDAYATLKDAQKRRVYDLYGEGGVHVYESPRNELGEMFGLTTLESDTLARIRRKARTYRMLFPVDLRDFFYSRHHALAVVRRAMCRCPKAGHFCPRCRGRPTIRENVTLSFFVEKGAEEGSVVLFHNAGDASELSAPGDVEVEIVSRPHDRFVRKGNDLHTKVEVTLKEALTGFERTIEGIDGVNFVVRTDGPVEGGVIRVKGKGMPLHMSPGYFGDALVELIIKWPQDLSEDAVASIAASLA